MVFVTSIIIKGIEGSINLCFWLMREWLPQTNFWDLRHFPLKNFWTSKNKSSQSRWPCRHITVSPFIKPLFHLVIISIFSTWSVFKHSMSAVFLSTFQDLYEPWLVVCVQRSCWFGCKTAGRETWPVLLLFYLKCFRQNGVQKDHCCR